MNSSQGRTQLGLLAGIAGILLFARFLFHEGALAWLCNAGRPLVIALLIIYLLQPIVNWLNKNLHLPRSLSVLISYGLLLAILAFAVGTLIPAIVSNVADILPRDYSTLLEQAARMPWVQRLLEGGLPQKLAENLPGLLDRYMSPLMKYSTELLGSVAGFFEVLSIFCLSLFMAYYALKETSGLGCSIARFLYKTIPARAADRALNLLEIINTALRSFIAGKCTACFILGMIAYISILLTNLIFHLDIPYAGLFSFLIGITNIIPYIGPLLGALPCLLLSLFEGMPETIAMLAIIIAGQQLDNMLIGPKILGDCAGVSPFWILASVTCGGLLFGGAGMILAVPAAQVIGALIAEYQDCRGSKAKDFLGRTPARFSHLRPKPSRPPE